MSNKFKFQLIWNPNVLGFSINYNLGSETLPLTNFYFIPSELNIWQLLKNDLQEKPWLDRATKKQLLIEVREVVNFWRIHRTMTLAQITSSNKNFNCDFSFKNCGSILLSDYFYFL